jgi:hypothetical protein
MSVNAACDYAGLPRSQVYKYLKMAEEPKARRECKEFADKLKRARTRKEAYKNSYLVYCYNDDAPSLALWLPMGGVTNPPDDARHDQESL